MITNMEKELYDSLKLLVKNYVANKGTPHQFITVITPNGTPWYWKKAIASLDMMEGIAKENGEKI